MSGICILPIEIGYREALGIYALASELRSNGVRAVVLPRVIAFQLAKLVKGCFVVFDGAREVGNRYAVIERCRSNGNIVALMDTEGVLLKDDVLDVRYPKIFWHLFDIAFVWGPRMMERLEGRQPPDAITKLWATGCPQFLYFRTNFLQQEAASLKANKETRVLWNTAFPAADIKYNLGKDLSVERVKLARDQRQKFSNIFEQALNLPLKNKLRVHPNESSRFYIEKFGNAPLENRQQSSFESILDSDVVVADNCTTLIEAATVGKVSLNLTFASPERRYSELDLVSRGWRSELTVDDNLVSLQDASVTVRLSELLYLPDNGFTLHSFAKRITAALHEEKNRGLLYRLYNFVLVTCAEVVSKYYLIGQQADKYNRKYVNDVARSIDQSYGK